MRLREAAQSEGAFFGACAKAALAPRMPATAVATMFFAIVTELDRAWTACHAKKGCDQHPPAIIGHGSFLPRAARSQLKLGFAAEPASPIQHHFATVTRVSPLCS